MDGWLGNVKTNPQALFSKDGLGKLVGSQETKDVRARIKEILFKLVDMKHVTYSWCKGIN